MTEQDILKNIEKLVSSSETAMIGTISKQKFPNIRAMKVIKRENLNTFYFSTKADSDKVIQIEKRKKGCIYFYDDITFTFSSVLMEGKFSIIHNSSLEISNFYKTSESSEFCIIKFEAINLYYYTPYNKYKVVIKK